MSKLAGTGFGVAGILVLELFTPVVFGALALSGIASKFVVDSFSQGLKSAFVNAAPISPLAIANRSIDYFKSTSASQFAVDSLKASPYIFVPPLLIAGTYKAYKFATRTPEIPAISATQKEYER